MAGCAGVMGFLIAAMRFFEKSRLMIKDETNKADDGPIEQQFRLKEYYE